MTRGLLQLAALLERWLQQATSARQQRRWVWLLVLSLRGCGDGLAV
jgi:hypothetical protein